MGLLCGAGMRIKLHIQGGGEERPTLGFAGCYLDTRQKYERAKWQENGVEMWRIILKTLVEEQSKAAAALLKVSSVNLHKEIVSLRTHEHLLSEAGDLTSVEVANIIYPKTDA